MPIVQVDGPPVEDLEARRRFVREVTQAASSFFGLAEEKVVVLIRENRPENVASGGELIIDRRSRDR